MIDNRLARIKAKIERIGRGPRTHFNQQRIERLQAEFARAEEELRRESTSEGAEALKYFSNSAMEYAIEQFKKTELDHRKMVYGDFDMGFAKMPDAPQTKKPRFAYGDSLLPKNYVGVCLSYKEMGISVETEEQPVEEIKAALQKLDNIGAQTLFEKVEGARSYDLVFKGRYPDGDSWEKAYQFGSLNTAKFWTRHVASLLQPDASLEDLWLAIGFTPKKIPTKRKRK